jgi:ribosomal protein S18 acetylase RimI-like enzyme
MSRMDRLSVSGFEYRLKTGTKSDRKTLLGFMQRAYQELCPNTELSYLAETVRQLWSEQTPFWMVEDGSAKAELSDKFSEPVWTGCVWLGNVIDPMTGDRFPHILLLYVDPYHRRRGLGSALMQHVESWAIAQGHQQLGLHVFAENIPALALYKSLGYGPQSIFLQKKLCDIRRKTPIDRATEDLAE